MSLFAGIHVISDMVVPIGLQVNDGRWGVVARKTQDHLMSKRERLCRARGRQQVCLVLGKRLSIHMFKS